MTSLGFNRAAWAATGVAAKDGGLDRAPEPYVAPSWPVPARIELDRDRLRWELPPAGQAPMMADRAPFDRFVRLSDAPPDAVVRYAGRWGVLGICREHRRPASHDDLGQSPDLRCEPEGWRRSGFTAGWEPLGAWYHYARQARAMLNIAASVRKGGRPHESDAGILEPEFGERAVTAEQGKWQVGHLVGVWLRDGAVRPTFVWRDQSPELRLGGAGLFGALAVQLMLAVGGIANLAKCSGCAAPYIPERKPRAGQRNYCPQCRDQGVPLRDAQRAHRAGTARPRCAG